MLDCTTTSGDDADGTRIYNAFYKGVMVFNDIRVPYILVEYPMRRFTLQDHLGQVLPRNPPDTPGSTFYGCSKINSTGGFRIECTYFFHNVGDNEWPACKTYKYIEKFEFRSDGTFNSWMWIYGPGYDENHIYHIHWRINFDINGGENDDFAQWTGGWVVQSVEDDYPDKGNNNPQGFEWRNRDGTRAYRTDPQTGDNAVMWTLKRVVPIEIDGNPLLGPGQFDDNQNILNKDIVDWYVAPRPFSVATCGDTIVMIAGPRYGPAGY